MASEFYGCMHFSILFHAMPHSTLTIFEQKEKLRQGGEEQSLREIDAALQQRKMDNKTLCNDPRGYNTIRRRSKRSKLIKRLIARIKCGLQV